MDADYQAIAGALQSLSFGTRAEVVKKPRGRPKLNLAPEEVREREEKNRERAKLWYENNKDRAALNQINYRAKKREEVFLLQHK